MNHTETPSVTDLCGEASDTPHPSLPVQVQKHLGSLLAAAYAAESIELSQANCFENLLTKLQIALDQAHEHSEVECRKLLLAGTPALRRFALSLTRDPIAADDLVQDTLLRAWKSRASFQPGTNFEAWTFTILRNQFYSNHRKPRELQDEDGAHADRMVSLPDQAGHLDLHDVQVALSKLPSVMREALILVTIEDFSYEEAATVMSCEIGTAKSRVWRARNRLAQLLGFGGSEIGNDAVMLSTFGAPTKVKT